MSSQIMEERSANFRTLAVLGGILTIGLIVTLLLSAATGQKILLNSTDSSPRGALALRLWMERSGFEVIDSAVLPTDLDRADVLFVLEPELDYDPTLAAVVREWVGRGNILVIAGWASHLTTLLEAFDVSVDVIPALTGDLLPGAPTLQDPPLSGALPEMLSYGLSSERDDVIPLLFRGTKPVLIHFPEGRGQVWAAGFIDAFTNLGLQDDQNARLLANIAAAFPQGTRVAFDDGAYAITESQNLSTWLLESAPGRGILIGGAIVFVFLAARGRRFGSPQPIAEETLRREPVEYIQAIAHLFRRAGGRDEILRHTKAQFRRRLSKRYGIDPRLADTDFARQAIERDPSLDEAALRDLLSRLSRSNVSEAELLRTSHDVDSWLRKLSG
ncbi:MAG: DUF4350 domain-containing protein [Anaerolineae bacterium]